MKTALQWLDERGFHYKDRGVWESDIEAIQNDARAELEKVNRDNIGLRSAIEKIVEAAGFDRYHSKGDTESLEWHSPTGKFCLLEDIPKELTTALDSERAANAGLREALKLEVANLITQLSAWHTSFGTSQLTHALAERESDKKRLEIARELLSGLFVGYTVQQGFITDRDAFLSTFKNHEA